MPAGSYLADTNILLRISQSNDPQYTTVRAALRNLRSEGARVCYTSQNLAEFWNVCTRPAAQNGYGLTVAETDRRARLVEATFQLLPDNAAIHTEWRSLVVSHSVSGVQVHDTRLVAAMHVHQITHILTLNPKDFARFKDIIVVEPKVLTDDR